MRGKLNTTRKVVSKEFHKLELAGKKLSPQPAALENRIYNQKCFKIMAPLVLRGQRISGVMLEVNTRIDLYRRGSWSRELEYSEQVIRLNSFQNKVLNLRKPNVRITLHTRNMNRTFIYSLLFFTVATILIWGFQVNILCSYHWMYMLLTSEAVETSKEMGKWKVFLRVRS